MRQNIDTARNTLAAMGFDEREVTAAIAALSGQRPDQNNECSNEPLLTPTELQERLKISSTSLWRMKELPYLKVGGRKRYLWSEVERHLEESQTAGRSA